MPGATPARAAKRIDMRDQPAREAVRAVADACRAVTDGRGRDAEPVEIVEPADAGALAPDAGVAQDHGLHAGFRREIGRIDAAMRGRDRGAPARVGRETR